MQVEAARHEAERIREREAAIARNLVADIKQVLSLLAFRTDTDEREAAIARNLVADIKQADISQAKDLLTSC